MWKIALFLILFLGAVFLLFLPELFPRCDCCHKLKLRSRFRYHKRISNRLSRKGNQSLCHACCDIHEIQSLDHYRKKTEIEKRMEYKVKWQL